jgi:mono/diheme cytochrome c family protein
MLSALTLIAIPVDGQTLPDPAKTQVDFLRDIEPLFRKHCQACHGARQQMNGLRLDHPDAVSKGAYSGPVVRAGDSAGSKLIQLVAGVIPGKVMPPAGPALAQAEVSTLRAWIDQGARWPPPAESPSAETPKSVPWAFQPITRPQPPSVRNQAWIRNPVDRFILAKLEAERIEPSREAGKAKSIRRLSLDLTGLPPTEGEVAEFLADQQPDAYERLVDRLLESPHYGEKWARHWLDQARYADSDGYEKDLPRPHAWRYRHWVIDALNRNIGFDQFGIEQIAGDLLPGATVEQKVATGFHRNTLKNREGGVDPEECRFEEVVDRTNTFGTVWLGLTLGCAQCHDHKYDPLTQRDYYRVFAFFSSMQEVNIDAPLAGEAGPYLLARPHFEQKRQELLAQYRVPELQPAWERYLLDSVHGLNRGTEGDFAVTAIRAILDDAIKILETQPQARTRKQQEALTDYFVERYSDVVSRPHYEKLRFPELLKKLKALEAGLPPFARAMTVAQDPSPQPAHIHIRGDFRRLGVAVEPGIPEVLPPLRAEGRPTRLDLARWLFSEEHPLTARVAVNRIWQEYFGRGLARTSEDFGAQGEGPSHPELLDWLAREFMDHRWDLKRLHRLIVTSAAYRQDSFVRPDLLARDLDNRLLARQARLRLPAELIRDSPLAVAGLLDARIGGRSVRPPMPKGLTDVSFAMSVKWEETEGVERYRRGVYIHFQRTVPYPQLISFDAPNANVTCTRRVRSSSPLQALNLLNDPMFLEAAQNLAARQLREGTGSLPDRLDRLFTVCLARRPTPREKNALATMFHEQLSLLRDDRPLAEALFPGTWVGLDRAEAAAWVAISRVLLNLDEFITRE